MPLYFPPLDGIANFVTRTNFGTVANGLTVSGLLEPLGTNPMFFATQNTGGGTTHPAFCIDGDNGYAHVRQRGRADGTFASPVISVTGGSSAADEYYAYSGGVGILAGWRCFTITEGGQFYSSPVALADLVGQFLIGVADGRNDPTHAAFQGWKLIGDDGGNTGTAGPTIWHSNGLRERWFNIGLTKIDAAFVATDWEDCQLRWSSNILNFGTNAGGTGVKRVMNFTAAGLTFTAPLVNTVPLTISGYSLTGANASSLLDLAGTWSTSGAPTAIKLNITNTGSGAASKLLDLQIGGSTLVDVNKLGTIRSAVGLYNLAETQGVDVTGASWTRLMSAGAVLGVTTGGFAAIRSTDSFGWLPASAFNSTPDIALSRQAAKIVKVTDGSTGGGAIQFVEMTAPSAPSANNVILFSQDNGAGKTQLMAIFGSGAAQQLAIEP